MDVSTDNLSFWKKCSSCKKEIPFGGTHYLCSVSTCNTKKTGLTFCSIGCWDAHLGFANHRSSEALEKNAPTRAVFLEQARAETEKITTGENAMSEETPQRKIIHPASSPDEIDTLVVVSKIKKLIRDRSDFNTSQCCIDALTNKIVEECQKAIENARTAGRKTVMGRDVF